MKQLETEQLRAELEQAKAEIIEQCRLNGMGAEREAKLMAQLEQAKAENQRLREALTKAPYPFGYAPTKPWTPPQSNKCLVCGQDHGGLMCPQLIVTCRSQAPTQGDV